MNASAIWRKVCWQLLPVCWTIVLLSNIDYGNVAFAANQFCTDLNLSHTAYGFATTITCAGAITARIPSNIFLKKFGAPTWLMFIMFCWGSIAASMSLVQNVQQFYVVRFLLGLAEGGVFPGVWYYVTQFFQDDQLTIPFAVLTMAVPAAAAVSGPIAAFFAQMGDMFGIRWYRYLFFFEGAVTAICVPLFYRTMPKSIQDISTLSQSEMAWLKSQFNQTANRLESDFIHEAKTTVRCPSFWIMAIAGIFRLMVLIAVLSWTTLMIEDTYAQPDEALSDHTCAASRSTGLGAILMTAAVFAVTAACCLLFGLRFASSRNRSSLSAMLFVSGGLTLALRPLLQEYGRLPGLLALTFVVIATFCPGPLVNGLVVSFFDAQTKSTALALFSAVDSIGIVVGPAMTGAIVDHYGNYGVASIVLGAFYATGGLMLLSIKDPLNATHPSQEPTDIERFPLRNSGMSSTLE